MLLLSCCQHLGNIVYKPIILKDKLVRLIFCANMMTRIEWNIYELSYLYLLTLPLVILNETPRIGLFILGKTGYFWFWEKSQKLSVKFICNHLRAKDDHNLWTIYSTAKLIFSQIKVEEFLIRLWLGIKWS